MSQSNSDTLQVIMLGPGLDVKGGISRSERLFMEYAPAEVEISHISTKEDGSALFKTQVFLRALVKLTTRLMREKIHLVHIHGSHRGSAFRQAMLTILVFLFRKPIILQTHASEFHIFYDGLSSWLQKTLAWAFGKCDRFIVLSKSWQEFYTNKLDLDPAQVTLLYNPVEVPPQISPPNTSNTIKFLFLGRIGERKGAFDLIKAYSLLPEGEKNNSELIMAGDGDVEEARNLVESLNVSEQITFPGWIDTEERDRLLDQGGVFVLPSYNEGLPLSMLEAMAWGLPVIVTPVGGISEIVHDGENGLVVEPSNIEQLSGAMKSLIVNEDLRTSLGDQGRKSVEPLDIKNYWLSFLNIYRSALQ